MFGVIHLSVRELFEFRWFVWKSKVNQKSAQFVAACCQSNPEQIMQFLETTLLSPETVPTGRTSMAPIQRLKRRSV